ncbi:hypothetical protein ACOSQ2_030073 [Xanthoceras sorbifolium]
MDGTGIEEERAAAVVHKEERAVRKGCSGGAQRVVSRAAVCIGACEALKDLKFYCTESLLARLASIRNIHNGSRNCVTWLSPILADNDPPVYKCTGAATYNIIFCPS